MKIICSQLLIGQLLAGSVTRGIAEVLRASEDADTVIVSACLDGAGTVLTNLGAIEPVNRHELLRSHAPSLTLPWVRTTKDFFDAWLSDANDADALDDWTSDGQPFPDGESIALVESTAVALHVLRDSARWSATLCSRLDPPAYPSHFSDDSFAPLASSSVLLVGAGAVGSNIGRSLAGWGIRNLVIFDPDTLSAANTLHTWLDFRWVGMNKAVALASALGQDFPSLKATPVDVDVMQSHRAIRDLFREGPFQAMVVAVDDAQARNFLNHTAVLSAVPTVFSAFYLGGKLVETFSFTPGGPCLNCVAMLMGKRAIPKREISPSRYRVGLTGDISVAAAVAARTLVGLLLGGEWTLPTPLAYWSSYAMSGETKALSFDFPFETNWITATRNDACLICSGIESRPLDEARSRLGVRPNPN